MDLKSEISKYFTFPMLLIGSGSFFGVIGWMGMAHAAESIIFSIGSMLLSLSGTMTTLCGLMSLERIAPSSRKIYKLKLDISKNLKMHYPTYILDVEKSKRRYKELNEQLRSTRTYYEVYRQQVRNLRYELTHLEKQLQQNLKNNAPVIDNDSADAIAKKLLWSEKQIQLNEFKETIEKLSQFFTSEDLEHYRDELTYINGELTQLAQGIDYYRELMIMCNQSEAKYDKIINAKEKVEKVDNLITRQQNRIENLENEIDTKCEETKIELSLFTQQLNDFKDSDNLPFIQT